jgi:ABC-type Co2+ transport system permease subunit
VTLLIAAVGIPRFLPNVSPRLVVRSGLLALLAGAIVLLAALDDAHVSSRTTNATLGAYRAARIDGLRTALAVLAVLVLVALFFAQRIPTTQPGAAERPGAN